ncbi:PAP2 superfamily protein [Pseudobutyrivibrio sp. YE44]|uniref:phosphatase PAP2 family protein n=1 Tax=Pseudobutyrivibrio sp. YE44 TaxID=1520802 RepID=UPI000887CEDE|nr:phosphatase PAP2 family protein [Pseudobutyrivibrio sp. YE44]SDB24783.1 PAP2 superfamily protein [Pseudobutyrivibrio sp. YE44]
MSEEKNTFHSIIWNPIIWPVVFVIGMAIFTFCDLPIAKAIIHYDSVYARFFEIIGLISTPTAGIFFAISNFLTIRFAKMRLLSILLSWLALITFVGFNILSVYMLDSRWVVYIVLYDVLFIAFSMWANRYVCSYARVVELRKVMMIGLSATLVAVLGQTLVKFGFNRPRFITLTNPDTQFTYWFVHHPFTADSSFPSGHAAQAALSFILVYIKRFVPKLRAKKWEFVMWTAAIFITGSTMISRIILGVHYATDVWAGCFLTLLTLSLSSWYVEKRYLVDE